VAVIFDGSDRPRYQYEHLGWLAAGVRPAPVLALLDFPRPKDRDLALAAGAAAVLSKPFLVQDLFWQLDKLLGRS
jgi:CheY-like chemotaxis protein